MRASARGQAGPGRRPGVARRWSGLAPDARAIDEPATDELLDPATLRPARAEDTPWARALAGAAGEALEVVRLRAGDHEQWLRVSATPVGGRWASAG